MRELRDKIYKIMYRIFIISIVIACFTTITLGSNVGHLYKFNDWLMKNNSDYRYGCDGSVSKNMYFIKYCYDKDGNPLWENEKNNLDVQVYKELWKIPFWENPNKDTLLYYLYKYLASHLNNDKTTYQWKKDEVEPSSNPYIFEKKLVSSSLVKNQIRSYSLLSYLFFEDGYIIVDEITPKNEFGDFVNNDTKLRSNSIAKSLTSYVLGHAICDGYIQDIDADISDWPLVKDTLYEDRTLLDLLNMAAGDQMKVDYQTDFIDGIEIDTASIKELMPSFKFKRKGKGKVYNYNNLVSYLILNYISFKTGDDFEKVLHRAFNEKARIENSVYFFKMMQPNESGNKNAQFFASRYDYLRIAKAIMDDYQNQTCEGKYLKEIYDRRIRKNVPRDGTDPEFSYSMSYGGLFHLDFPGIQSQVVFGMTGGGGQVILIDMDNSRIVVLNSIHFNRERYKYNVSKLLINPIKNGFK